MMMLRAYAVFVDAVDEFQRRIQSEAITISAGVVGFGSFAYGFLEEWAGFPHLPLIWVLPALIGVWGAAACVIRLRYK
jgi:phosphate/sulfate permease